MASANKKSHDAKAYINAQVNEMREKFSKAHDGETREQLIENFNELTSSDEYQRNLSIVQDDTDVIRDYARRKKWWDITPEEFKDAKTEFYGKNMNLEFWKDFEKLDLWKKVDYIVDKFWDTDYAADLIIDLLKQQFPKKLQWPTARSWDVKIKNYLLNIILSKKKKEDTPLESRFYEIEEKFWRWPIALRLHLLVMDNLNWENWHTEYRQHLWRLWKYYKNITQKTLKPFMKWSSGASDFLSNSWIIDCCEDWSISDHELIRRVPSGHIKKLSLEWQKFLVDIHPKDAFVWDDKKKARVIDKDINFLDESNVVDYVLNSLLRWYINNGRYTISNLEGFCINELDKYREYHEELANILIKMWKIDIVKKYINKFTWLSENRKAEIMWDTEFEDKLNREKFDADLAMVQELWAKLWKSVVVTDIQEIQKQKEEPSVDENKTQEDPKQKRKWWQHKK